MICFFLSLLYELFFFYFWVFNNKLGILGSIRTEVQYDVLEIYNRNLFRKGKTRQAAVSIGNIKRAASDCIRHWLISMEVRDVGSTSSDGGAESSSIGDSIPSRSKIPTYYTLDSLYELDWICSSMRKFNLRELRERFKIPNFVIMRLPKKGEKASQPREGKVTFFEAFLGLGLMCKF